MSKTTFAWLEITEACQLTCKHCYASCGPRKTHGIMKKADWLTAIDDAADIGVASVQFIGGEPSLHPDLPEFVDRALSRNLEVEVFSNLTDISGDLWSLFSRRGVSLATSYYSDVSDEHERITGVTGSFARTTFAIKEAVRRSIPLRVGVIGVLENQRTDSAVSTLRELGIEKIGVDHTRRVGRASAGSEPCMDQLCGKCGHERLAISSTGDVWPCVFSRWLKIGNILTQRLFDIINSQALTDVRADLDQHFSERFRLNASPPCFPDCAPACQPNCSPSCSPSCSPRDNCTPSGNCWPNYR